MALSTVILAGTPLLWSPSSCCPSSYPPSFELVQWLLDINISTASRTVLEKSCEYSSSTLHQPLYSRLPIFHRQLRCVMNNKKRLLHVILICFWCANINQSPPLPLVLRMGGIDSGDVIQFSCRSQFPQCPALKEVGGCIYFCALWLNVFLVTYYGPPESSSNNRPLAGMVGHVETATVPLQIILFISHLLKVILQEDIFTWKYTSSKNE